MSVKLTHRFAIRILSKRGFFWSCRTPASASLVSVEARRRWFSWRGEAPKWGSGRAAHSPTSSQFLLVLIFSSQKLRSSPPAVASPDCPRRVETARAMDAFPTRPFVRRAAAAEPAEGCATVAMRLIVVLNVFERCKKRKSSSDEGNEPKWGRPRSGTPTPKVPSHKPPLS